MQSPANSFVYKKYIIINAFYGLFSSIFINIYIMFLVWFDHYPKATVHVGLALANTNVGKLIKTTEICYFEEEKKRSSYV